MRLRVVERVHYAKCPLVEVVSQINFPQMLEIDEQLPVEFQKAVRDDFPLFETQEQVTLAFKQVSGQLVPEPPQDNKKKLYHFFNLDKTSRITLSSNCVNVFTSKYERWEAFTLLVDRALAALTDTYGVKYTNRVGLRYINIISKENIGLVGTPWAELIQPFLLGVMNGCEFLDESTAEIENNVANFQSTTQMVIGEASILLNHGYVLNSKTNEKAFLIDADYSNETTKEFTRDGICSQLGAFH